MIATAFGTTTGLTSASGLNFRCTGAARGIRSATIGGGRASGAVGTGASMRAFNNPRSGNDSTKYN